jgi:hypothetical protein
MLCMCSSIRNQNLYSQCKRDFMWSLVENCQHKFPSTGAAVCSVGLATLVKGKPLESNQFLKLSCMKFKWPLFPVQNINKTSGLTIKHGGFNSTENCDTFETKIYKY